MKKFSVVFLLLPVLFTSCFFGGERVRGNGNMKTEQRNISAFDEVEVHGALHVFLTQGPVQPVRIEGDENLLQYIEVVQQGGTLEIRTRSNININPSKEMKVFLTAPEYKRLEVTGACNITGQNRLAASDLKINMSGASEINLEVDVPELTIDLSGASKVALKGETKTFKLSSSGAAKAMCFGLLAEETVIDISGAGEAEVYASRKLDVEVSGAGNVRYKGEVKNINQQVSGAGSVQKAS